MLSKIKSIIVLLILYLPAMVSADMGDAGSYERVLLQDHAILARVSIGADGAIIKVVNDSSIGPEAAMNGAYHIGSLIYRYTDTIPGYRIVLIYRGKSFASSARECDREWKQ